MSNDCTGGRSGYEDVQSLPCDRDPMPRKNNQGGARPASKRNQQVMPAKRVGRRAEDYSSLSGAPVGVSGDLQQYIRFGRTNSGHGLRMSVCAPIVQALRECTTAQSYALQGASQFGGAMQLSPTNSAIIGNVKANDGFVSPVFDLIASAFVRYRVKKLVFHYEPQCAATVTERLVFAFANDPNHPLIATTTPSTTQLLALSDSVAFAPWRSWSLDVTNRLQDQLYYCYGSSSTVVGEFEERFSDFGAIGLSGATVSQAANVQCGIIYMEIVLDLEEFCPISVTRPAFTNLGVKLLSKTASDDEHFESAVQALSNNDLVLYKATKQAKGRLI